MGNFIRVIPFFTKDSLKPFGVDTEFNNIFSILNNLDAGTFSWGTLTTSGILTATTVNATTGFQQNGNTAIPLLQLVTATGLTTTSTTSSLYTATVITANITPKTTTSKIKIIAVSTVTDGAVSTAQANLTLKRGSTDLGGASNVGMVRVAGSAAVSEEVPFTLIYWDSPASTSSLTYTVYLKNTDNATTVRVNQGLAQWFISLEEYGF